MDRLWNAGEMCIRDRLKTGREGEVELALLAPADSFGEMALADKDCLLYTSRCV